MPIVLFLKDLHIFIYDHMLFIGDPQCFTLEIPASPPRPIYWIEYLYDFWRFFWENFRFLEIFIKEPQIFIEDP